MSPRSIALLHAELHKVSARNEIALARLAAWFRLPIPRFGEVIQVPVEHRKLTIVDRRFVEACHRRGVAVHVWTVNDRRQVVDLDRMGVDAVITDDPTVTPSAWRPQ